MPLKYILGPLGVRGIQFQKNVILKQYDSTPKIILFNLKKKLLNLMIFLST